ncbi:MAG: iron-containing alcohol dehydrogenase, partial [Endomicrobium sp.]|nr:iron-containing alcohol dehydrogenase [Endomicrobium sp.]
GEVSEISLEEEFAHEKLSPVIAIYKADSFEDAVEKAYQLVELGGAGHTSVLYTDERKQERINYFAKKLHTGRVLINTPSSQGGIGDLFNFKLEPSLTLGCGSWGGNAVSENVGVKHLLNYKTVAERRENMLWFRVPPKIYFKRGATDLALRELEGKKRAFIVTDRFLFNSGAIYNITKVLEEINIDYQIFFDVKPDPTVSTINEALTMLRTYEPDVIIAFGGGSPIDAAKIMWLMYENPDTDFKDVAMRFMDIRKRIYKIPELGTKAQLIAIPTTSGTGSEVTPFAVITEDSTHIKYPIADYALTPNMAIIDPNFVDSMPKGLCAASGIDALTHAVEAYVSVLATNFTNSPALEAVKLVFRYLPRSYSKGSGDPIAREKMHYASTLAGMAFANAFLGLSHSLAHKLGAAFNIPHGIANALVINQVIRYNANDKPRKQAIFPQYKFPNAKAKYGQIADNLDLGGKNDDEKVELLIKAITKLKKDIQIPLSIKEMGVSEKDFNAKLETLAEQAFDDQCTGANPVYPLMDDIREVFIKAYKGEI